VKPVGGGVSELRIHEGKGYRVYLCQSGQEIVLLLYGGNKKTQIKDIADAKRILKEIEDET
jgi:putative addiction module killer protein